MEGDGRKAELEARLRALLESHGGILRAAIRKTCPRGMGLDVDEIEQQARLRIWRALESESELARPASYIYRVAVTATIDAMRRVKARREESLPAAEETPALERDSRFTADPNESPERLAERQELLRTVASTVDSLAANRRAAVRLHLQGFSSQEIAGLLGWTEPKARNLTSRGLRDLRHMLKKLGIGDG